MTGSQPALSLNQEFLCSLDHGETSGAFSQWYTVTNGLRVLGPLDIAALSAALDDVVARHEILRTTLHHDGGGGWHQRLHPPAPVTLRITDVPPDSAYDLLNDIEAEPFSHHEVPLLRAALGRLGAGDHVLALTTHHVASDAWSMQVIITDLAACYAARAAGGVPDLPRACQYREFAGWQRAARASQSGVATGYWRDRLLGARLHALAADRALPEGAADPYSVHRFTIGREPAEAAVKLARTARSSLFVVLLAAYNVLASQLTGEADLVVPTFTAGRNEPRSSGVVGPLYNLLPIRTDLREAGSFADVIARTRASCLQAYANDIPFPLIKAQAPDLMAPCGDDRLAVSAFEMFPPPVLAGTALAGFGRAGDLRYAELRGGRTSTTAGASTPKGMLWALDQLRSGELAGLIRYSRNRLDAGTIASIATRYGQVLSASVASPAARLVTS